MTNQEMTERYVYAVTRRLPADTREDVAKELNGLIGDMLEEQTNGAEATTEQLRAVLTQLGNPYELAASYHPQQGGLIPQPYYTYYLMVLRIVLAAACGGVAIALLVASAIDPTLTIASLAAGSSIDTMYESVSKLVGGIISGVFSAGVQAFTWVTIIFAVMARKAVKLDKDESFPDTLPELPANRKPLGKGGAIVGIILSTVFPMILLLTPGIICIVRDGGYAPVFDPAAMRDMWWVFIGLGMVGIVSGCAELIEGYRTRRLMVINLVCNAVFAVLAVVWLGNSNILSAGYHHMIEGIVDGAALAFMSNLNFVVLGGILIGITVDMIDSVCTTLRR